MVLKVLIISNEFPPSPGGIGNHAYSLSKALVKQNINVSVLCDILHATSEDLKEFDEQQPFKIYRIARKKTIYWNRFQVAKRIIKQEKIEKVIVSGKFPIWLGALLKIFLSIQTIAIIHGSEVNLESKWLRKFTHWSLSKSNKIVAVSSFTKSLLPKHLEKTAIIIPNGIDLEEFEGLEKKSFNLKGEPSLLTVGNVTQRKGQHRVVKSLPTLLTKYPNLHYNVVGLPTNKDKLEKLAKELSVENSLTLYGRLKSREELFGAYQDADIFIILSENQEDGDVEGFGIVVLEANYFGIPVIGAKGCGIEDAIEQNFNGCLVDGNNPNQVLDALTFCSNNRVQLSHNAIRWAKKHDWNSIVKQFLTII